MIRKCLLKKQNQQSQLSILRSPIEGMSIHLFVKWTPYLLPIL